MNKELILSEKYEPLFEWLSCFEGDPLNYVDTVVITGGRNSQKSFAVGAWSCVAAKDYNHRILYTRYTITSAQDSIIPEFKEKIEMLNCYDDFDVTKDRITGVNNKSKVVFKGIKTTSGNQTASLKSLKGFSVFVLEEAEEMPNFEDWDKIKKSIRAKDVRNLSVLLLNPATKAHWIYEEFFESMGVQEGFNGVVGNVLYIHSSYLDMERDLIADNIWEDFDKKRKDFEVYEAMSRSERESAPYRVKKNWSYYKHVVMGGWLNTAEGVIYENWKTGDYVAQDVRIFGGDFGFSTDPTTLIDVSINLKRKKIYAKECMYKTKLSTTGVYKEYLQYAGEKGLIYADSAEPRLIEELKKLKLNIKEAVKGQGSLSAGISMLLDFELIIDPSSTNLIRELNNYVWHDKKSKTPIDAYNHLLDALRYAVYSYLVKPKFFVI